MPKRTRTRQPKAQPETIAQPGQETSTDAAATNETPLEYMLRVMRDVTASNRRRDVMARAAVHQLPADPPGGNPQDAQPPLSRTEIARRVASLLAGASDDKPKTD